MTNPRNTIATAMMINIGFSVNGWSPTSSEIWSSPFSAFATVRSIFLIEANPMAIVSSDTKIVGHNHISIPVVSFPFSVNLSEMMLIHSTSMKSACRHVRMDANPCKKDGGNGMANSLYNREQLAGAIYIINKHAKTAPDNEFLYKLKKAALMKMVENGFAEKIGLQSVPNPKLSRRQSAVLITCGEFHFHLPPTREEMKELPHLGEPDPDYRNPKVRLGLKAAKHILQDYTGVKQGESGRTSPENLLRNMTSRNTPLRQEPQKHPSASGRRNQQPAPSRHRSWFDQ